MTDEDRAKTADREHVAAEGAGGEPPAVDPPRGLDPSLLDEELEQPITLDRYLSRRRPPVRSTWSVMLSLLAMLVALVMIMVFKDRCGEVAGDFMNNVAPAGSGAPARPESREPHNP